MHERNCAGDYEQFSKSCAERLLTDISLLISRACEYMCWNCDKSTPFRSETNGFGGNAVSRISCFQTYSADTR